MLCTLAGRMGVGCDLVAPRHARHHLRVVREMRCVCTCTRTCVATPARDNHPPPTHVTITHTTHSHATQARAYTSIISACGRCGQAERAAEFYREMRAAGLTPMRDTFLALLNAFAGEWWGGLGHLPGPAERVCG